MPATVVTPQTMAEFITSGKVEPKEQLPPMGRETIALKKSGKESPKVEVKAEPKPETKVESKEAAKPDAKPAVDDSKKVDDAAKSGVKDTQADPSAKTADSHDTSEDDLPERARKAIGKKHREMKQAEEYGELQRKLRLDAEKRVKELEAQLAGNGKQADKSEPTGRKAADDAEPKPEDYPNVAAYTKALVKWEREQADTQRAQQQTDDAEKTRHEKAADAWRDRVEAYRKENPDFDDLVAASPLATEEVPNRVIAAIQRSELGPQLILHLAAHSADWKTLRSMNADDAIKYLGKLELKIEAAAAAKAKPAVEEPKKDPPKVEAKPEPVAKNVSKAPPPADISVGTGEPIVKNPADMNFQEYREYRNSQRKNGKR